VKGEFPTLGYVAIDWIESNLLISDGPKKDEPFELYPEQQKHLLHKYRLDPNAVEADRNDAFMYGGSMLVRGQKWGKDPLLAALVLFHAFGPCDFAGWDANGEPVGRPHPSPWVAIAARIDEQTNNTWTPVHEMAQNSPEIYDTPGVEIFDHSISLPGGNEIEKLSTTAWNRLGGRFTYVSITENGILTGSGDRGGLAFARTLKRSVAGMNGMWTGATNTWDPTELSDAQVVFEAKDKYTYVDAKLSRKHVDMDDDEALQDELEYLYGDSLTKRGGHVSMQRLVRDCRNPAMGESEVRRFFLSEIIAGTKPLADPTRWANRKVTDDPLKPGDMITLGFDGSRARDATVLTATRLRDLRVFHLKTFLPEGKGQDRRINRVAVDQAVQEYFKAYDVKLLYADPFKWQDYLDKWAGLYPKRVIEVPTNQESRIDALVERFTNAVITDELTWGVYDVDEADTLSEHIRNTALKKGKKKPPRMDADGQVVEHYLAPVKKREGLLIDGAISAMLSYAAAGQAIEDGALNQKSLEPFAMWGD